MCWGRSMSEAPLLGDGSIVRDYKPLFEYWRISEERGLEKLVIESSDIDFVKEYVQSRGRVNLAELMRMLSERIEDRVSSELAAEAYSVLGIKMPPDIARKKIAEIVAGWTVEACNTLNIIKLRYSL